MNVYMYGQHIQQIMEQPGKVANPAMIVVSLTGEISFPCPRSRLKLWSRETGSAVPSRVSLRILHTKADIITIKIECSLHPSSSISTLFEGRYYIPGITVHY